MKLGTFSLFSGDLPRPGIFKGDSVIDVVSAYRFLHRRSPPWFMRSVKDIIANWEELSRHIQAISESKTLESAGSIVIPTSKIHFHAPILNPGKILCTAVNYFQHALEAESERLSEPYVFIKLSDLVAGHNESILRPKGIEKFDHELELAVIIGKQGKYISRKNALDYVFGYTIFNDISFRDRRLHSAKRYGTNWLHAKSLDVGASYGPWIVTKDEIKDPQALRMKLSVNGETRQDSVTADMIFTVAQIIEYVSNGITLRPGDIISTGTPPGTGLGTGKFLRGGDTLDCEIEGLGKLINTVKDE